MSIVINPLFSIIIPTFNSEKTLTRCLESILSQNFLNYEIWLIDGRSEDKTISIIQNFSKNNHSIKYISEPDKGIYDAMNKGIGHAQGEWLYFLGSDDTLYNDKVLNSIAARIQLSKSMIIHGDVLIRGNNEWNMNEQIFGGEFDLPKLLRSSICHQAIFYNKLVFEKYGNYNLRYNVNADYEFNLRCYAFTCVEHINIIVANFFVGGQSTTDQDEDFQNDRGAILFKYFRSRIYSKSFLNSRLYLRQAALSIKSPLTIWGRLFCLTAYIKLKLHAILTNG